MQVSDVELALGRPAGPTPGSGVYVWADAGGGVLYLGESAGVADRIAADRAACDRFAARPGDRSLWDAPDTGLAAVLARAGATVAHGWPIGGRSERRAAQQALIRLAALQGATPAGQGADWAYGPVRTGDSLMASAYLQKWYSLGLLAEAPRHGPVPSHDAPAAPPAVAAADEVTDSAPPAPPRADPRISRLLHLALD